MDVLRNYIFIIYMKNWKETATFDLFPYTLSQICSGHLWQIARLNEFVVQPGTNKQTNMYVYTLCVLCILEALIILIQY